MKTLKIMALAVLCGTMSATAQTNYMDYFKNPTWHECASDMNTAQVLEFDDVVRPVNYTKDVVYNASCGEALTLQILSQKRISSAVELQPCVVFIPGSAWMKQNVYSRVTTISQFAQLGYVVAVVEYTHSGLAAFPAPLKDVKAAIRYMRKNADKYSVDANNIFVWGDSSGGHLSLMAAFTNGMPEYEPDVYSDISDDVNACVAYYGVTDIRAIHGDPCSASTGGADSPEGMLMGKRDVESCPDESDAASPVNYVSAERPIPPVLIAVGTCDHIVPFSQSETLARKLESEGKTYKYYVLKGADHGSWQFWTSQMFKNVDTFFKQYIK